MGRKLAIQLIAGLVLTLYQLGLAIAQQPLLLDESCVVTIGNQTVLVKPDGTFLVRNISVFQSRTTGIAPQLYRVRATCLRNDEMITGQSTFFSLTPGSTSFISDVLPSTLEPLPVNINVTTNAEFLTVGATAQLSVTATLPDGSTKDVTTRATGTTYLSTNPNLLTVSEDGLVTGAYAAAVPQNGMIAVLNEGNVSTVFINAVGQSNEFDIDNDGMPNDYEDLFGLNKFSNDANGDLDGDGLTNIEEFNLGTLPNNPDTDADGIPDGLDGNPLLPDEEPPMVAITFPAEGASLVEGETILATADATDDGLISEVVGLVNGVVLATTTEPPYELMFTVPYAAGPLVFEVQAKDSSGNASAATVDVTVIADALTTVQGTVVDQELVTVNGADVSLNLSGLKAEFFDFDSQLTALPDLTGLTPDITKPISAINFINPDNTLSLDTFGVGFEPDFAARFTGMIRIPVSGLYTFTLGVDDGARLVVNGLQVAEVIGTGEFTVAQETVNLIAGLQPISIEYYQGIDDAELQLSIVSVATGFGGVAAPSNLTLDSSTFDTSTGPDGQFSIPNVPTILGDIQVSASATINGEQLIGRSTDVQPIAGGVTDVGQIRIQFGKLFATSSRDVSNDGIASTNPGSLFEIDIDTGLAVFIGTPENSTNGLSDVAFNPVNQKLYAMHGGSSQGAELLELDPADATVVNRVPITGATFSGSDALVFTASGTLYIGLWSQGRLATLDPATGQILSDIAVSGGGGNNHLSDLAINPITGDIWASRGGSNAGRIVQIDPVNGNVTTIIDVPGLPRVTAISFNQDGILYASFNGLQLAIVDTGTGQATLIGTGFGGPKISGLGFQR